MRTARSLPPETMLRCRAAKAIAPTPPECWIGGRLSLRSVKFQKRTMPPRRQTCVRRRRGKRLAVDEIDRLAIA